jgi:hypothetical protein
MIHPISIEFKDRKELQQLLLTLNPATKPLWGKMNPQQMVEHLVDQVQWTNGKKVASCDANAEESEKQKQWMIYSDAEIPKNVFLEDLPVEFQFNSMETAINQLMIELDDFDHYFEVPGITAVHGGFGAMNHQEWLIWHGKHFGHHLKQFNLRK